MSISNAKYSYFIVTFLFLSTVTRSQQIYFEVGGESANFNDYVNNTGENTLDENHIKSYGLFFETGVRLKIYKDRLYLNLGVSHNNYKMNTAFYRGSISTPLSYDLSYFTIKPGITFSFVNRGKFKFLVHTHFSSDWLIAGTSAYEDVVNNLYQDQSMARSLLRYHRGLSVVYSLSKKTALSINFNVSDSFKQIEKNNAAENYSLHSSSFSFGILMRLHKVKTI